MPSPKKFGLFFKKNAMEALNSTGLLFFLKQTLIFTQRNLASVIAYSIFWSDSMLACTTYISAVYSFWLEFTTRTMFRGHIFISFHITCLLCLLITHYRLRAYDIPGASEFSIDTKNCKKSDFLAMKSQYTSTYLQFLFLIIIIVLYNAKLMI